MPWPVSLTHPTGQGLTEVQLRLTPVNLALTGSNVAALCFLAVSWLFEYNANVCGPRGAYAGTSREARAHSVVAKKEVILMDKRFTALRIIGTVFKILAWISLIFGLLGAIGMLVLGFTLSRQQVLLGLDLGGPMAGIAMFIVVLVISIFGFLSLYAIGESVYLFLSIEENTRRTAYIIQQQYSPTSLQAPYAVPPTTPDYED